MTDWDLLLTQARLATMRASSSGYGLVPDGAIAIRDGVIAWAGRAEELPTAAAGETRSLGGRWVTPALIDCHTHLVFGGDRGQEYEERLQGSSYEDISRRGGGILSTVRATREASHDDLFSAALPRLEALRASGAATIEIKSGYGLDLDNEIKMLEVARQLGEATGTTVFTTLLAAHTVPPEYAGDADSYIDFICEAIVPVVAERGLADAVDAYCESIAFTAKQVDRLFSSASAAGLAVKLHADQLSAGGGAELAARHRALSADHLEYASAAGVEAMAAAGTAAVLLPGAFLTLQETQLPPVDELRRQRVPIAIATDCNPGTSPLTSIREAMALASRLFGLTPEECLAGTTRHAARSLGLTDRGSLDVGLRADLAIWDVAHPRDLSYWMGRESLAGLLIAGRDVTLRGS